jgi:Zn-dependent M28 family amino/carboxypeptidase
MPRRLLLLGLLTACAPTPDAKPALDLSADRLLADITVLASDSFQGRAPGTAGEERTVAYLTAQFKAAGLEPGNPDGSWVQAVDLVGIKGTPRATFRLNGTVVPMAWKDDFVAVSRRVQPEVIVPPSELVFVGYGVVAPEYDWDDYKNVDVRGKTVVMLVNDPAVPDGADPSRLDAALFRGDAMTYYGRWTYKYEIATEKGAAAVLLIHEDGPAGYPWEVVRGGWTGERMDTRAADGNASRVAVEGWLTSASARALFAAAGEDFAHLKERAVQRDFAPVVLNGTASFQIAQEVRDVRSANVVAKLAGTDEALRDEVVVFTAHWDHFGIGEAVDGDSIYNGAADNATGTAALLELARAFTAAGAPKRSVLFVAVTGEEQGLLGSKWYASNPLYPLEKTLANFNIDVLNTWGATSDLVVVGSGSTTLEDVLAAAATEAGRTLAPDPEPSKGFYYRSDHFEFAKRGVPALYLDPGTRYIGKPEGYGAEKREAYTANLYHKPADEVDPSWDLSGAIADLRLWYAVARNVADGTVWPTWKDGTEFKAVRERSLGR